MYQQTSLLAYIAMKKERKIGPLQQKVLEVIKSNKTGITNHRIAKVLGREINSITPRTNELVEMGLVYAGPKSTDKDTGKTSIFWMAS